VEQQNVNFLSFSLLVLPGFCIWQGTQVYIHS
jgi:hypothetical protein